MRIALVVLNEVAKIREKAHGSDGSISVF